MRKIIALSASLLFMAFAVKAQQHPVNFDKPAEMYTYKLKLATVKVNDDLELFENNVTTPYYFDNSIANFDVEHNNGMITEQFKNAVEAAKADKKANKKPTQLSADERELKRKLKGDSIAMEVVKHPDFIYTSLILLNDTLKAIQYTNEPMVYYYFANKTRKVKCSFEEGMFQLLHQQQISTRAGNYDNRINDYPCTAYVVKLMNLRFPNTTIFTNEIKTSNLVYNLQYPRENELFPVQFNLFKNSNKYCFLLNEVKTTTKIADIIKSLGQQFQEKTENLQLNKFFEVVGFDY